ncbi:SDR family oxidoreductase [Propionibacteriaceae bacterium Y1685]|uniref:SDR family oxidoreductase n=1 Tax=Microlunatus sp. Y1700 TaxID=3418487 RepID=UPI003B79B7EB
MDMSTDTLDIVIIGGHGKVALLAAPLLVEAGHRVASVIRNPDHVADVESTGATAVVADVERLDEAATRELLANHDVVVWSAGAGGGSPERTYAVDRDAAIRTIDAAAEVGARRYVMVSYFGAGPDHGVDPQNAFFAYAEAKTAADEHLRQSSLDWTILKPSGLTLAEPTGRISTTDSDSTQVSRANVAATIAAAIANPATAGKEYAYNDGDTPITEAIA